MIKRLIDSGIHLAIKKKRRRESEKGPINLQFLSPSFSPTSSIICVLAVQLCFWSECQVLDRGISPEGESVYSDGWWDKNNWCDLVLAHSVVIFCASKSSYFFNHFTQVWLIYWACKTYKYDLIRILNTARFASICIMSTNTNGIEL